MDDVTQWTEAARADYAQRAEDLIDELRRHVEHTLSRHGRQAELRTYFGSAEQLRRAVAAFNDAEFDWCGSFPVALRHLDDDVDGGDEPSEASGELVADSEMILCALRRWDFRVIDRDTVIAAGRAAYSTAWPTDIDEDARVRVTDVEHAAAEIVHAHGFERLSDVPGLEACADFTAFALRAADEALDEDDPFNFASW